MLQQFKHRLTDFKHVQKTLGALQGYRFGQHNPPAADGGVHAGYAGPGHYP
jgi:hypothetical protein